MCTSKISCLSLQVFFFFNDTATTEIYTLSLHDALPICLALAESPSTEPEAQQVMLGIISKALAELGFEVRRIRGQRSRSEEHTSELQSRQYLVCRLLLEKKKTQLH